MPVPEQPDGFMTVAEVAAVLKLNQQTVLKNWIDLGKLPAVRIGRRVRVKRSDFDALVEASYAGGTGTAGPPGGSADIWDGEIGPPEAP